MKPCTHGYTEFISDAVKHIHESVQGLCSFKQAESQLRGRTLQAFSQDKRSRRHGRQSSLEVENQSKASKSNTQTHRHTHVHTNTQCRFLLRSVLAQMCQIMSFFLNATLQHFNTCICFYAAVRVNNISWNNITTVQNYTCVLSVLGNVQCLGYSVLFSWWWASFQPPITFWRCVVVCQDD